MNLKRFLKLFFLPALVLFVLVGCSNKTESPEVVLKNFMTNMVEVKSGDILAELNIKGAQETDELGLKGVLKVKFDVKDIKDRKADINLTLKGLMKTAQSALDGEADLSILTASNNFYIKLDKLSTSDATLDQIKPVIEKYSKKWLHISSDLIPEDIKNMQEKDEAAIEKENQIKKLFAESTLFNVTKEYGVESINGNKAYHLGLEFNKEGVKKYITEAYKINGTELTTAEIDEAAKITEFTKDIELWIGTKDFYLYKAKAVLNGGIVDNNTSNTTTMELVFEGNNYNKSVEINTPENFEELNPLDLMMAYGNATGAVDATGTETAEEEALDEETTTDTTEETEPVDTIIDNEPSTEDMIKAIEAKEAEIKAEENK